MSFPNLGPKTLKLGFICFTKISEASSKSSISLTLTSCFGSQMAFERQNNE